MAGGSYRRSKGYFAYIDGGTEPTPMAPSFARTVVEVIEAIITVVLVTLPALALTLGALLFAGGFNNWR